jgi:valyl-tRNA synthetase
VGGLSEAEANQQGIGVGDPSHKDASSLRIEDRWLLSRLATLTRQVTEDLENYKFADAARALYDFAWNEFCSFYVEMTKARFAEEGPDKRVAQRVMAGALDQLLRLLHPMMPFLTEEVWQLLHRATLSENDSICVAEWPKVDTGRIDPVIEEQFATFQGVLGAVREVRQGQNVPFKENLDFFVRCDAASAKLLAPMQPYFTQMANATLADAGPEAAAPELAASKTVPGMEVHVDISRFIDVEAEKARLAKERDNLMKFTKSLAGKLSNKGFVDNAPAEVVEQQRVKLSEAEAQLASVEQALAKL